MPKNLPMGVLIVTPNEATGLVPTIVPKLADLERVKRGDVVRIMVKFPREGNPRAVEQITCLVSAKTAPLLRLFVYSRPEFTQFHTIDYADELTLHEQYVIQHECSTPAQAAEIEHILTGIVPEAVPINEEDRKLRQASQVLPPLIPTPGKQYWLRDGTLVNVWTFHQESHRFIGGMGSLEVQWNADGTHAGGIRDLDIVKDPSASEVVA